MENPTEGPLVDSDPPCSCGHEGMELERTDLYSKLTGAKYDCIRCTICKTVFFADTPDKHCEECGNPEDNHMSWCENSEDEWPDVMFDQGKNATYKR